MIQENDLILVECSDNATKIEVVNKHGKSVLFYNKGQYDPQPIELPKSKKGYDLIGKASDLTEGHCKQFCEYIRPKRMVGGYKDYYNEGMVTISAISSLNSLLKKHSMIASKTLILKKKS